ncbi:MAG TPA: hypothetical protein VGO47_11150 [Chlamydiales bacterium]|jgi:hypothetical protein|nr:hypothetical protein [Chlamydiales bacterium]
MTPSISQDNLDRYKAQTHHQQGIEVIYWNIIRLAKINEIPYSIQVVDASEGLELIWKLDFDEYTVIFR